LGFGREVRAIQLQNQSKIRHFGENTAFSAFIGRRKLPIFAKPPQIPAHPALKISPTWKSGLDSMPVSEAHEFPR
jgi:hypothetical protein